MTIFRPALALAAILSITSGLNIAHLFEDLDEVPHLIQIGLGLHRRQTSTFLTDAPPESIFLTDAPPESTSEALSGASGPGVQTTAAVVPQTSTTEPAAPASTTAGCADGSVAFDGNTLPTWLCFRAQSRELKANSRISY